MIQHLGQSITIPASRKHVSRLLQYIYIQYCRKLFINSSQYKEEKINNYISENKIPTVDVFTKNQNLYNKFFKKEFKYINHALKALKVTFKLSYYPFYKSLQSFYESKKLYFHKNSFNGTFFIKMEDEDYSKLDKLELDIPNTGNFFPLFLGNYSLEELKTSQIRLKALGNNNLEQIIPPQIQTQTQTQTKTLEILTSLHHPLKIYIT